MGDGLGRVRGDPGFELLEISRRRLRIAHRRGPGRRSRSRAESTPGEVRAEEVKDRRAGQDGQLGPDGQVGLFDAQQPAGPGVPTLPGDIAAEVERPGRCGEPPGRGSGARSQLGAELPLQEQMDWGKGHCAWSSSRDRVRERCVGALHQCPDRQARVGTASADTAM